MSETQEAENTELEQSSRLRELAAVFLRLGFTAFGGPAAHIAMMDDEVVKRRQWLDRQRLLDLFGATSLIPGPNSTELAIHIGYERAGWSGLLVAGSCFILPAMASVWLLAAAYVRFGDIPEVGWLLYGIKPVIIAIVIQALIKLGGKAIKDRLTGAAALVVLLLFYLGLNEILLLVLAGLGVMILSRWGQPPADQSSLLLPLPWLSLASLPATTATSPSWIRVFLIFLKIGSVLYGSGYVLLAFLQRELVERHGWLTPDQLLDAVAIGQFTPGPVFTTATFIGYLLAGNGGAVAATIGIFLPAFVLVAALNPFVSKLRSSPRASGFLDGVNAASLGLMAVVTVQLGIDAVVDPLLAGLSPLGLLPLGIAIVSLGLILRYSLNSAWLVLGGGLLGWAAQMVF